MYNHIPHHHCTTGLPPPCLRRRSFLAPTPTTRLDRSLSPVPPSSTPSSEATLIATTVPTGSINFENRSHSTDYRLQMISGDIRGRASCYKQDWIAGIRSRFGILAAAAYIFSSTLPIIAFGEQHRRDTDDSQQRLEDIFPSGIKHIANMHQADA